MYDILPLIGFVTTCPLLCTTTSQSCKIRISKSTGLVLHLSLSLLGHQWHTVHYRRNPHCCKFIWHVPCLNIGSSKLQLTQIFMAWRNSNTRCSWHEQTLNFRSERKSLWVSWWILRNWAGWWIHWPWLVPDTPDSLPSMPPRSPDGPVPWETVREKLGDFWPWGTHIDLGKL